MPIDENEKILEVFLFPCVVYVEAKPQNIFSSAIPFLCFSGSGFPLFLIIHMS